MRTPEQLRQSANHVWHVWMNSFATEDQAAGRDFPHSLYEFKSLLDFLEWGPHRLEQAFTDKLPATHKQCSHAAVESIPHNTLKCCLGTECVKCEILIGIKSKFDEERQRECGNLGKFYEDIPDSEMYRCMANTCAWHIYKKVTKGAEGFAGIDTTEGHLMDVSDRMFWDRVYESMSPGDDQ